MRHGKTILSCPKIPMTEPFLVFGQNSLMRRLRITLRSIFAAAGDSKELKIRSNQEVVEEVIEQLKILENELTGKEFFGGDKIGNLDIVANVLAFWFIVGQEFSGVNVLTEEKFPMIYKWIGTLRRSMQSWTASLH
ncbi:hypothetical protein SLEP1_g41546 [Rubroshorea leprosula]|uniref:GST C-terminal domain-containing protein n=1 Tax=Rubroshorea leprosula TaxID=152421 RepID=A0AAV5L769_9ROSI|nr:hypothetical protein SLEP1_g41546 [Rubroshorea leprosula]